MPLTNWPPSSSLYPAWPPSELLASWFSTSDLRTLLFDLKKLGFTQSAPTSAETNTFFRNVRCDEDHAVVGRMLVSPDGTRRYPFAACNNAAHRQLLVLWPPDYCMGAGSGIE